MGLPLAAFSPRKEGTIQLILGQDNPHLWPYTVAASRYPTFSLQFFRSRLSGGLIYAGSLAAGWKKKKGIAARRRGSLGVMMGSVPGMIMLGAIAQRPWAPARPASRRERWSNWWRCHDSGKHSHQKFKWAGRSCARKP
jgi:hypothetical protein